MSNKKQKKPEISANIPVARKSASKIQWAKYRLPKKDWSKICSMTGETRRELLDSLFESEQCSDKQIADLMAEHYHLQKINFAEFELDPKTVMKISRKICEKYCLIPVQEVEGTLVVAFSDPGDIQARDDVSLFSNSKVEMVVAEKNEITRMIKYYHTGESADKIKSLFSVVESSVDQHIQDDSGKISKEIKHDPTVQTVDHIIKEGIKLNCSDIHVEVYEQKCRVRYRVDGHLAEYIHPPFSMAGSLISRIKVISRMDISEKRLPQDGRLKIQADNQTVSFRVSTVPVVSGEKIVMRVLDTSVLGTETEELGMNEKQMAIFQKYLKANQGLILMTGPTGSGKTTTIYSGLQQLNKPHRNISTAEDPVEYKLHGINQVQVNTKIGLTFANVLRSFLRQDPDIILVGEIRDQETATIAYRASATGHLVLSTLHTNDAPSTVTRLVDIGIPVYSVAENTSVVIAQRLLRTLCNHCKTQDKLEIKVLKNLGFSEGEAEESQAKIMKGAGCQYCNHTGYKGRTAVFEVMDISPELKAGIFKGLSPRALKKLAVEQNHLQTLRKSALEKLTSGLTSVDEVLYGTLEDDQ